MKGKTEMKDTVRFPVLLDLRMIDFSSTVDVCTLVRERCHHMFGVEGDGYIDDRMDAIAGLFAGTHPDYQAMDTAYHDITHTLQATLCLTELLHKMPSGLQQTVGETGWRLSHGERNRIFLARALLQEPDVLVLDESFAALDPANLQLVFDCVLKRAKTLVVIAHP